MTGSDRSEMSEYEIRAWERLIEKAAGRSSESNRLGRATDVAKSRVKAAATRAKDGLSDNVPGAERVMAAVDVGTQKALAGLHTVFVERGLNSVSPSAVFLSFAKEGAQVTSYDDIKRLDLKTCDHTVPRRKEKYIGIAMAQGAATSLAVTGATVSATVSGGTTLTVAAAAMVADLSAVMVGMGRIVALVAAHYGYDVREPDEQVFASGVLSYSTAGSAAEKAASLGALSRLTQEMMRRATWRQLERHQLVKVIQKVVTSLGFKLTHRKLGQVVPIAGVVINSGLNARLAQVTFERAQDAYRLRFLTEKYGLDPALWAPDVTDAEIIDIPLVDELVDAERDSDDEAAS